MRYIAAATALFLAFLVLVDLSTLGLRIYRGRQLSSQSLPFEREVSPATGTILVVGDSTGVGTGAFHPGDSIAGRIAREFPGVAVTNRARNGAKTGDVIAQLRNGGNRVFDIVLIQTGGNDILRFTPLGRLRDAVETLLDSALIRGDHVIFLSTGNVGLAPAFFPPLNWIYTWRTRQVREILIKASAERGVEYVDLFREKEEDPFTRQPERFYAPDFLHPGGGGYGYWYEEIKRQSSLTSILSS